MQTYLAIVSLIGLLYGLYLMSRKPTPLELDKLKWRLQKQGKAPLDEEGVEAHFAKTRKLGLGVVVASAIGLVISLVVIVFLFATDPFYGFIV